MLQYAANVEQVVSHKIGNKNTNENCVFSEDYIPLDDFMKEVLHRYFLNPFKEERYFHFAEEGNLQHNKVYTLLSEVFDNKNLFLDSSEKIAKFLYETGAHPDIEGGQFYMVEFSNCIIENEAVDGIGIFKAENKEKFLKIEYKSGTQGLMLDEGFSLNKLDKGCLIFNREREKGFAVSVFDSVIKSNSVGSHYWMDAFLQLEERKDAYFHTQNALSLCKTFVTEHLPEQYEISKADQAAMLNKSVNFFKKNDNFDMEEFTQEVIAQPELIENFKSYKKEYEETFDQPVEESFDISNSAVKKQSRMMKSVIKLDKNFHIYVHGNQQYIEKGFDESTGLHYYRLSFKEEN